MLDTTVMFDGCTKTSNSGNISPSLMFDGCTKTSNSGNISPMLLN
jgi:hypothetical protein